MSASLSRYLGVCALVLVVGCGQSASPDASDSQAVDESSSESQRSFESEPITVEPLVEPSPSDSQRTGAREDVQLADPSVSSIPAPGALQTQSPLDLHLGTATDPRALSDGYTAAYEGHAESVTRCMRAHGYDGYTYTQLTPPSPEEFLSGAQASDSALVSQFGYGPVGALGHAIDTRIVVSSNSVVVEDPSIPRPGTPAREVYSGHKSQCLDDAAAVIVLPDQLPGIVTDAFADLRQATFSSQEMQELWAEWSSCLAATGQAFGNRADIAELFDSKAAAIRVDLSLVKLDSDIPQTITERFDALAQQERQVVLSDLACAAETNLDARMSTVISEAETRFLAANGDWIALEMADWRRSVGQ